MMTTNILTGEDSRSRWGWAILVLLGAMAIAAIILSPQTGWVAVGLCGAVVLLSLASDLFRGRIDRMLVGWAALFPLGMFCAFPREHAFVTLEREMLVLAAIALLFAKPSEFTSVPKPFRRVGVACLAFIAVSALSLGKSPDFLYAARQLIDLYVVPLLFAWGVVAWFDVRRYLPALHIAVCISAMISASVAAAEVVTGQDYLPAGGSVLYFAGDVARANGPFASDDQLALIGGVTLFFLILLRAALGDQLSTGRKFLHSVGLAAAVGMTVMPLFRSAMTTLVIVLVIDTFWERKASRRVWRIALIVAFAAAIVAASILLPRTFEDRSGAENGFARVAQYQQDYLVFRDYPLLGAGFSNFHYLVEGEPEYATTYNGATSQDWPHSNFASALAETGILGFVPYVMMHILLVMAMWQLRRRSASGRLVWKYFVFMFLVYWITGVTESSGFTGTLNMWYAFAVAVAYKYALTEPHSRLLAEVEVPSAYLSVPT